jgi:LysM repeat protein
MASQRLHKLVLVSLIVSALILGACTRSASTPPATEGAGTVTTDENWQQATMDAVRYLLQTQNALATAGVSGGAGTPEISTPEVLLETPIPTAEPPTPTEALPPTAGPSPTPGLPATYTLQDGEHPFCIARRFNVNPGELLAANQLTDASSVRPGDTLIIPQGAGPFPPPRALMAHPTTYTVTAGDTIYIVACLYGDIEPMAIVSANGLASPYSLTPGSVIDIP